MSDLDKRAKEYAKNTEFVEVNYYLKKRYSEKQIKQAYKDGATQETALLSQHILDLQKDKGNLTDKVRELEAENEQIKNSDTLCKLIGEQKIKITELEAQIEKMKRDVFECFGSEYNMLVAKLFTEWEIKENGYRRNER